ncbi:MAG: hypothetical protein WCK89_14545 [bacterium]
MAFVCLFLAGCKKRPPLDAKAPLLESVLTNRMHDAAYLGALKKNREVQTVKAGERNVIVTQMQACIERVKATLPKDADEATLKAALAKDAEWCKLEPQNARMIGEIEQVLGEARQTVRQRMLEESRAVKAVAAGQAKAADQTVKK